MNKLIVFAFAAVAAVSAFAEATVSDVVVRQRWPWSRKVDINYVLTTDKPVDITVAATSAGEALTLAPASLAGDLNSVETGVHRITWDPSGTEYEQRGLLPDFKVTLLAGVEKRYMIINLKAELGDGEERITYSDCVIDPIPGSNAKATWECWPDKYKTDYLVLRRIPKGTFKMGSPANERNRVAATATADNEKQHAVTLTKDYYIGIFEVTQAQFNNVVGSYPSSFFTAERDARPVENVAWTTWRGLSVDNWPDADGKYSHDLGTSGFFVKLRALTDNAFKFDMPTEAQWEKAARAGTETPLYTGEKLDCSWNATQYDPVDLLTRYGGNVTVASPTAETVPADGGTAVVGSYQPNAYGLFDVIGNVFEFCLDGFEDWLNVPESVKDPKGGSTTKADKLRKGGAYISSCGNSPNRTATPARSPAGYNVSEKYNGTRVCLTLE